jgi:heterodisulfide reductase subunit A-like polyferredoxin
MAAGRHKGEPYEMSENQVLVVGSGVAGLSAALSLAKAGVDVALIEREAGPGGHAVGLACKAAPKCVRCGACMAHTRLTEALAHGSISLWCSSDLKELSPRQDRGFRTSFEGVRFGGQDSTGRRENAELDVGAVVLATGFDVADLPDRPYGYGRFPDVITNLELENRLRRQYALKRPSDDKIPGSVAYIQCVGSRDRKSGRLWCSRFCCGSALRTAAFIRWRHPDTDVTVYHIDIQNFGRDFEPFYHRVSGDIHLVRSIPGDIVQTDDGQLRMTLFDSRAGVPATVHHELVVLSTGMQPSEGTRLVSSLMGRNLTGVDAYTGTEPEAGTDAECPGLFIAGAAGGPMTIAEAMASGNESAARVLQYLEKDG